MLAPLGRVGAPGVAFAAPRRRVLAVMLALTAGAFALRAVHLGRRSLWLDEGYGLLLISARELSDWTLDVHPPLYYALLLLWSRLDTSDVWLRLLSAVIGAATVPVVYALGARLLGRAAGLWAAAFLAVTWLHVWHSREVRMYPLLVLAFAVALWGIVAGARDGQRRGWAAYALGAAGMAWSHGIGVYYAAILAGLALAIPREDGRPRSWRPWLIATGAVAALYLPLVPITVATLRMIVEQGFWIRGGSPEPPFLTTLHTLTVEPIFPPGALVRSHLGLPVRPALGAGLWIVPVLVTLALALVRGQPRARWTVGFLAMAYAAPIGVLAALSLVGRPILIPRALLPLAVPLALLLAVGVEAVPWRRARWLAGAVVGGVLLLGAVSGVRHEFGYGEDWRGGSRHLQAHAQPGDALLVLSLRLEPDRRVSASVRALSSGEWLLLRYDDTGRLQALPRMTTSRAMAGCRDGAHACLDAALRATGASGHLWVVRRFPAVPEVQAWLDRFPLSSVAERRGLTVEQRRLR